MGVVKLGAYLQANGETYDSFSKRSGVPTTTVGRIVLEEADPRASTCEKIVRATGGLVSLSDLVPPKAHRRARDPRRRAA